MSVFATIIQMISERLERRRRRKLREFVKRRERDLPTEPDSTHPPEGWTAQEAAEAAQKAAERAASEQTSTFVQAAAERADEFDESDDETQIEAYPYPFPFSRDVCFTNGEAKNWIIADRGSIIDVRRFK